MNGIREGLIPTILGSAVTAAGYAMKQNMVLTKWWPIRFLALA